jgi:hypothetical protein
MFEVDRTFSSRNPKTGLMDWFFSAREGVFGPYSSKVEAAKHLKEFIEYCKVRADDGGRSDSTSKKLAILPKEYTLAPKQFDPTKRKKGVDSL